MTDVASLSAHPRITVVVRSYNRLAALGELLTKLLAQDHDSFEVVVIEQSTVREPLDVARLNQLAEDPRIRIHRHEPLGGPGARNAGVRAGRGDLFVFIDDDDLPVGTSWLTQHEANFADPKCLGVTGQFVTEPAAPAYVNPEKAQRDVLSFNLLKWQRVYTRVDQAARVESLMGGNAAIPRTTLERFGLWDECTPIEDEPSLAYRINKEKRADEYLRFEPSVKMIRRLDIPGGMAKRTMSGPVYARRVFAFMHNVIGHYFPVRFVLLYPLYIYMLGYNVIQWICSDSKKHTTLAQRIWATTGFCLVGLPLWSLWLVQWWYRRLRYGSPPHRPELNPLAADSDRALPIVAAVRDVA